MRQWLTGILFLLCCATPFSTLANRIINTPAPASGRASKQAVLPADVLARVKLLQSELNLIREAMGKPIDHEMFLKVGDASPREVYYQAQALYQKANNLAYEVAGNFSPMPKTDTTELRPIHVWRLVNESLKRVLLVKQTLGIQQTVKEKLQPKNTTPTEVYNAILQTNQTLNHLLYKRTAPSDVYEQITLAINYTEQLLRSFDVDNSIPSTPTYIPNKSPADVHQRLTQCVELLGSIAKLSGVQMLNVQINQNAVHHIAPNDVYDLSKIIVAEVSYFHAHLPKKSQAPEVYYPGYKLPSDVYQRAGILLKQLQLLEKEVQQQPNWLRKNSNHVTGA
tara:strand:- start:349 stop:1359 length:1011 start_codon:yes stop_codon:yes gene_type:complete